MNEVVLNLNSIQCGYTLVNILLYLFTEVENTIVWKGILEKMNQFQIKIADYFYSSCYSFNRLSSVYVGDTFIHCLLNEASAEQMFWP